MYLCKSFMSLSHQHFAEGPFLFQQAKTYLHKQGSFRNDLLRMNLTDLHKAQI